MAAALLLVGQARVHVFIPGASAIRPALTLSLLGLGLWVAQKEWIRSPKRLNSSLMKAGLFVALWAAVGVPFALWQGGAARYLIQNFAPAFVVFLLVAASVRNLEDVRRLVATFALGTAAFALMAPQNRISRAFGAGGYDPNDSAMFLVSGIPILIFFTLFGRKRWVRAGAAVGALLALYAIIDTQSRGGFLGVVAVLAFMVLMLKGVRPALRAGVVAVVILASIPVASTEYWDRMETIQEMDDGYGDSGVGGRRNIWTRAVEYTMANPVTGVGINNFPVAEGAHPDIRSRIQAGIGTKYSVAHSMWFNTLAELGVPGFLAFAWLFAGSLIGLNRLQSKRARASPPLSRREGRVMAGVLMASLIGLMATGSFLSNQYLVMVWGVLGIVVGLVKVTTYLPRRQPPSSPTDSRTTSSSWQHPAMDQSLVEGRVPASHAGWLDRR